MPDTFGLASSPIGTLLVAWQGDLLVRLHLLPAHSETQLQDFLSDFGWHHTMTRDDKRAGVLISAVLFPNGQWRGVVAANDIALGFHGTDFQHTIMRAMLKIPAAKTKAYGALTTDQAARAVGSVCARNPLPFIVPCHRVTKADQSLGSYAFGTALKRQLLAWEQA